jgi:hypothetical protein
VIENEYKISRDIRIKFLSAYNLGVRLSDIKV